MNDRKNFDWRPSGSWLVRMLLGIGCGASIWGATWVAGASARPLLERHAPLDRPENKSGQAAAVGQFSLTYESPIGELNEQMYALLQKSKLVDAFYIQLRKHGFNLPNDIPIYWANCSELVEQGKIASARNAFYSPSARIVVMCYEFLAFNIFDLYVGVGGLSVEDAVEQGLQSIVFVLYHELGHALIHNLSIPIAGREEDAADLFAAYFLLELGDRNIDRIVLAAADTFKLLDIYKEQSGSSPNYFGEHSLGLQRFANLVCAVYGKDEIAYANLPKLAGLPPERQRRCKKEYEQVQASWTRLIVPHLLPSDGGWGNSGGGGTTTAPASQPQSQPNTNGGRRW